MKLMNRSFLAICFSLFYIIGVIGQETLLEGIVVDEKKEELAFVNILIGDQNGQGITTDINGRFRIESNAAIPSLTFSYVGFETLIYELQPGETNLRIVLKSIAADLPEALVVAGENPAHRIIRNAIRNRRINQPEYLGAYQCQVYNKLIVELLPNEKEFEAFIEEKEDTSENSLRQQRIKRFNQLRKNTEERHLLLMESLSERQFLKPDKTKDKVIHNRVSGFKHPSFVALANDIQPFSFYNTYLEILDKAYLNPISPGSTKKYFFNLEDSLFQNQDTVFIISYHPRKGKNFEGLEGLLYINSNSFAIQNVIARPYDKSFIRMVIEQSYAFLDNRQWFPQQLNFEIEATKYPHKLIGMRITGKSYIDEVVLEPELEKKDFRYSEAYSIKDASTRKDSIWDKYRYKALTEKEKQTYNFMDSLGAKKNFDLYLNLTESLANGRLPIGKADILLTRVLNFNDFEGTRLGLGLATNDRLSKFFEIGAFGGYGFKDEAWKYGGYLQLNLLPRDRLRLRYDFRDEIREPSVADFQINNSVFTRRIFAGRMDNIRNHRISLAGKGLGFTSFNLSLDQSRLSPLYAYRLAGTDIGNTGFNFAEISLDIRFRFNEKIIRFMGTETVSSDYPEIFLSYRKGLEGFLDGDFDYQKLLVSIEDNFRTPHLGTTEIRLEGGWTQGEVIFSKLFGSGGIGRGFQWLEVDYVFQTMDLYEFLSDRFVHLFFKHNFESHLLKIKNWKPEISVIQNVGFGMLDQPEIHQLIDFQTMEKGYYETGLQIDNLLRFNYFNLMYLGVGMGVYYRTGAYAFDDYKENLAYRFRLRFSY